MFFDEHNGEKCSSENIKPWSIIKVHEGILNRYILPTQKTDLSNVNYAFPQYTVY